MKVELVGLSQGISFEKKQATNYLDFRKDTGDLFRLEVPASVAEELLSIILKEEMVTPPAEPRDTPVIPASEMEEDPDATSFGGEEEPFLEPIVSRPMSHVGPSVESEDDLPSV